VHRHQSLAKVFVNNIERAIELPASLLDSYGLLNRGSSFLLARSEKTKAFISPIHQSVMEKGYFHLPLVHTLQKDILMRYPSIASRKNFFSRERKNLISKEKLFFQLPFLSIVSLL